MPRWGSLRDEVVDVRDHCLLECMRPRVAEDPTTARDERVAYGEVPAHDVFARCLAGREVEELVALLGGETPTPVGR